MLMKNPSTNFVTALSRELRHNTVPINSSKKAEHRTQYASVLSLMSKDYKKDIFGILADRV